MSAPIQGGWSGVALFIAGVGCSASREGTAPGECTDRMDNDWDAYFDCADPDCFGSPDCRDAEPTGTVDPGIVAAGTDDTGWEDWSGYADTVELVRIPAGSFTMGCTVDAWSCDDNETPLVEVTLTRDWWASSVEVTQGLYWVVTGDRPSHFPNCADCPVEEINWYEAVAFCNGLSDRHGLTPAYAIDGASVAWDQTADGWRLPTEAEWEYMARANRTDEALLQGEATESWFIENAEDSTHPVGMLPANPFGLHDVTGNVNEWTWDWYGPMPIEPQVDPTGQPEGASRVVRGAAWSSRADQLRVSRRMNDAPEYIIDILGMRLVRNAE